MKLSVSLSFLFIIFLCLQGIHSQGKKKTTFPAKDKTWLGKGYIGIPSDEEKKKKKPIDLVPVKKLVPLKPKSTGFIDEPFVGKDKTKITPKKKPIDGGIKKSHTQSKKMTPNEIWAKLSHVTSYDDLFKTFPIDKKINYKKVTIHKKRMRPITDYSKDTQEEVGYVFSDTSGNVLSADSTGTSGATTFKQFECSPRPKVVEIPISADGAFWPACTEILQCGGCCTHLEYKECTPTALENKTTTVLLIPYSGEMARVHNVYMLQHSACRCSCRIKPSDCKPRQTHDENTCACRCLKKKLTCPVWKQWSDDDCDCVCKQNHQSCVSSKVWSTETCQCVCPTHTACPSGFVRDPHTCYCLKLSV